MKKTFTLATIILTTFLFTSSTLSAQVTAVGAQQGLTTFAGLITTFNNTVVKALATLFLSGAVVAFFFGVAKFIWGLREGKSDAITNGRQFMIWSLVGLFVMFSVYGIIKVAQSLVPGLNATSIDIPNFNMGGSNGSLGAPTSGGNTGSNPLGVPSSGGNTGGTYNPSSGGNTGGVNTPGAGMGNNSLYAPSTGGNTGAVNNNYTPYGADTGGVNNNYTPYGADTGGCQEGYILSDAGTCVDARTGEYPPSDTPSANCTVEQGC